MRGGGSSRRQHPCPFNHVKVGKGVALLLADLGLTSGVGGATSRYLIAVGRSVTLAACFKLVQAGGAQVNLGLLPSFLANFQSTDQH